MTSFKTLTGSVYEVDDDQKIVRRVLAGSSRTVRMTDQWRAFDDRTEIEVGKPVAFRWTDATEPLPGSSEDCDRLTVTSPVTAVPWGLS